MGIRSMYVFKVVQTFLSARFSDSRIVLIMAWETSSGVGCCFGQTGMSAPR